MSWWLLFLVLFLVWCLWAVAATLQVEVENVRNPLPGGERRGMSPFPAIPVFPLVFFGISHSIDFAVDPWGTIVIASLHAVYAAVLFGSIIKDGWRLRLLRKKST